MVVGEVDGGCLEAEPEVDVDCEAVGVIEDGGVSWITGNWQPLSAHPPHPPNSSWNYPGYTSISKPIVNL